MGRYQNADFLFKKMRTVFKKMWTVFKTDFGMGPHFGTGSRDVSKNTSFEWVGFTPVIKRQINHLL